MPNLNLSNKIRSSLIEQDQQNISLFQDETTPRMIINEIGEIVFCNKALENLNDAFLSDDNINIHDIFDLQSEIIEGINHLSLKNTNAPLPFHMDWVKSHNNQKMIVASLVKNTANQIQDSDPTPFLDLSFDACCITSLDGKFITINDNFEDLFGYALGKLNNKSLFEIIAPEYREVFQTHIEAIIAGEKKEPIETYCHCSNNTIKWVEWKHKISGNMLYSTGRDLTQLKSYKESLIRQQKKLTEAEAIGHIGQWEWTVGTQDISFSEQLYRIFGVEKNKFNPTLDNINDMIDRRDSGRMMQVFQRAIIEQNDYDMDFRLTRPDGDIRYIRCEGRCTLDGDDDVTALYGIMQDVTDSTLHEIDLIKAKDCVERAYAAKTQFLANMSHELRTPLNAIIGFSEMMERQLLGPIGTEKYLEYIGGIRESGEHLLDLISDILDMSKIEAGKYELNVEQFNISKVIQMAAHMMEGRALDSNIKINLNIEDDLKIVADRRAVMQMILNLLSNAVKFSHKDSAIAVTLRKGAERVAIEVQDHGIGIPANKLANITMPFEQAETDYTREYEGSGLGLAITKELAEIHGGALSIASIQNKGTTVTIKLPFEAKTC